ncbi:DNA binding methylated-DNA--cysteine S-methyltransferase [Wilcoxina mikolae CBS 423.85]|nr:DNA binding methylated-DNA--cysteine S-methyltransferase [Wilcoxina mikolae CBS 423.85]
MSNTTIIDPAIDTTSTATAVAAPTASMATSKPVPKVTPYQEKVYALLRQIPAGKVSTYKQLSDILDSSPRAVGGALRKNPFAPEVPCHRVIASTGYIGGFMGDWEKVPSGVNCDKKLQLLKKEGVDFDERGMLKDKSRLWGDFQV